MSRPCKFVYINPTERLICILINSEAKEILEKRADSKEEREAELLREGYPGIFLSFAPVNFTRYSPVRIIG